jgi:hypothetical protein
MKISYCNTSDNYYYGDDGYSGFSLVDNRHNECFPSENCKESFTEIYWDHVDEAHTKKKIILFKGEDVTEKWARQAQNVLNVAEGRLKTPKSKVTYHHEEIMEGGEKQDDYHRLIIEVFSPLWFKNGPMIHLFCLLVRNAYRITANRKKWETILETLQKVSSDKNQFTVASEAISSLMKHKGELILYKQTHLGIVDYANEDFM